jgi:DNA helicase-2/ATP-dependent DNA helicase PcrA
VTEITENSKEIQEKILGGLNSRQFEATKAVTGSTLVIAGAGSGKTAVLTRRVAYLIAGGTPGGQILCLTFTNKAAKEMNTRVNSLLENVGIFIPRVPIWSSDYQHAPLLSTFHSLGVRLLREFGEKIELKKEFSILDMDDQKKIIREILKELNVDQKNLQPSLVTYFISQCKQELLLARDSRKISKDFLPIFHQVYAKYEAKLKASSSVDFDDLILLSYILLRDNSDVRSTIQERWRHVLVDEFQDTNPAQFEIIRLIAPHQIVGEENRSLFVVGDDAQSIYAFRGSKIEIILNFEKEYPGTKEIILNQNYRSTQPILDLAEKVLSHNPRQKKKDLFTENKDSIKVCYYLARNEQDEAEFIMKKIWEQYGPGKISSNTGEVKVDLNADTDIIFEADDEPISKPTIKSIDPVSSMFDVYLESEEFAPASRQFLNYQPSQWTLPTYDWSKVKELDECTVLYRTHAQSRSLEETFLKYKLPYRLVSGTRFLDRKEIKDVLAILKFLSNGEDKISLRRFLPLVMDGVGPVTMGKIEAYLEDFEYPLAPKYQEQIMNLFAKMQASWQQNDSLIELTKALIADSGYLRYLKNEYPGKEDYQNRLENIGEIYSLMFPFDEDKTVDLPIRLQRFLEQVGLMSQLDATEKDTQPKVNLMSLHQSKGLEFDSVFLVGVEDGLLPHQNSFFEASGMEEEVRLAYVGVTRAKRFLHLISADSRIQFGNVKANPVSRIFRPFLDTYCQRVR